MQRSAVLLARAGTADDGDNLAGAHFERDAAQHFDRAELLCTSSSLTTTDIQPPFRASGSTTTAGSRARNRAGHAKLHNRDRRLCAIAQEHVAGLVVGLVRADTAPPGRHTRPSSRSRLGIAGLLYFALCYPLSLWSRSLERRLNVGRRQA